MTENSEQEVEAIRSQLQHSYEALRSLATLAIQMCGFLVAADTLLLGYGLSQKHAGFLLLASAMPPLLVLLAAIVAAHGFPMVYVALRAERRLAPNVDTLCSTYLSMRAPTLLRQVNRILDADDSENTPIALRRLASVRNLIEFRPTGVLIMILGWLGQLALFVVALWLFNYRLL